MSAIMYQKYVLGDSFGDVFRFALGHATAVIARDSQPSLLLELTELFQALYSLSTKFTAPHVLELLLTATESSLDALSDKSTQIQAFAHVVRQWADPVIADQIDDRLIGGIRRLLIKPLTEDPPVRLIRLRFVLEFAPPLASVIFAVQHMVTDLPPSNFLALAFAKEMIAPYKDGLATIIAGAGMNIAFWIVQDIYEKVSHAKNLSLSPPRASPFATVCQWVSETTDKTIQPLVRVLIDVFKPCGPDRMLLDFVDLQQPVHVAVLKLIAEMFAGEFAEYRAIARLVPAILPAVVSRSEDLARDVWRLDWFAVAPASHSLLLPAPIDLLAFRFTDAEISAGLGIALMRHFAALERFFLFYARTFPASPLVEVFSLSPVFHDGLPPQGSRCAQTRRCWSG
jgi:hypothetical protein